MYAGVDFTVLDVGEEDVFTFNFAKGLGAGETILTAAVAIAVNRGSDSNPSSRLFGSPVVDSTGTQVSQTVNMIGGPSGNLYLLTATAVTSLSRTLILWSHFPTDVPS